MLGSQAAAYSGNKKTGGFSGYISDQKFYFVLHIEEGIEEEKTLNLMNSIKEEFETATITDLSGFDHLISHIIKKFNFPSSFSIATGYLRGNIFYLKTVGKGKVFLQRGRQFAVIIEKDKSASGYAEITDSFIFTTDHFVEMSGGDSEVGKAVAQRAPDQVVQFFSEHLKDRQNEGAIALFVQFNETQPIVVRTEPEPKMMESTSGQEAVAVDKLGTGEKSQSRSALLDKGRELAEKMRLQLQTSDRKKQFTLVAVIIIFCILMWSVVLGVQRRGDAEINKKVQNTKELVNRKLTQAEEMAFLNLPRSLTLIAEAKQEVDSLKKEVGDDRKEVAELEHLIKEKEGLIIKKEEKNYEEFYDLTLDTKNAQGDRMSLEGEFANILDRSNKTIYTLSLAKKSIDKKNASETRSASFVVSYKDDILFFVPKDGVFRMRDDKVTKVIENDPEWGEITGASIYNGNLYLLDSGKGDVYKYIVTEGGYSEKSSYLKGESGKAKHANSIAIDSSVYIGFDNKVLKYTSGIPEEFDIAWPEQKVALNKIFTNADVEKVYGWDKAHGALYILGKSGAYERQINSSILTKASDFIVFGKNAYVLVKEKIFEISLE